jgi:hypothetical protein
MAESGTMGVLVTIFIGVFVFVAMSASFVPYADYYGRPMTGNETAYYNSINSSISEISDTANSISDRLTGSSGSTSDSGLVAWTKDLINIFKIPYTIAKTGISLLTLTLTELGMPSFVQWGLITLLTLGIAIVIVRAFAGRGS